MPVVGEHVTFKIDSHPIYLPEAPEEEFSEEEVNLQIVDHILKGYAQATRIDDQALAFMDIYDGPASEFLNFAESKLDKLTRRPKNDDIPRETVVEHRQRVLDFVASAMEQNQIKPPKRDPAATKPSWSATRIEPVDLMANLPGVHFIAKTPMHPHWPKQLADTRPTLDFSAMKQVQFHRFESDVVRCISWPCGIKLYIVGINKE